MSYLVVLADYSSKKMGAVWSEGQVVEADPDDVVFLLKDAPGCFAEIHPDIPPSTRGLIQEVAPWAINEDLDQFVEVLGLNPSKIKKALEDIQGAMAAASAPAPEDDIDDGDDAVAWDDLTVKDLNVYLDQVPDELKEDIPLKKKGDIVAFIEGLLGKVVIPLDAMVIPDDVITK